MANTNKTKTTVITQTGVMLALLIILQAVTKPAGTIVTGSCVNAVLAMTALCVGLAGGLVVAAVSPFFAFLLGIGPAFLPLTPMIAIGNMVFVTVIWLLYDRAGRGAVNKILTWAAAALAKFAALYLLIVKGVCTLMPLPEPQVQTFSTMFSFPQLITAAIGGAVAIYIATLMKRARR